MKTVIITLFATMALMLAQQNVVQDKNGNVHIPGSYYGDGSHLTGIGGGGATCGTPDCTVSGNLSVGGNTTMGTTVPGGAPASSLAIAGKYYGDGSALTGVSGGVVGIYSATSYGCATGNSASANATCVTNALSAISTAGGGSLWFPPATSPYVVGCFTVPNSGGSVPTQKPMRIYSSSSTNGYLAQNSGAVLDLRCNTSARILSLGSGTLEIDHITLINGNLAGGDTVPFILVTNTTLLAHDLTIIGDSSLIADQHNQDAIQLGGGGSVPGNTAGGAFSGYGTQIVNVWANHIKRFLYMHSGPTWTVNGIQVVNNVTWAECGSNDATNGAQVECSTAGSCKGNYFAGNLYEGAPYKWFHRWRSGSVNRFVGESFFDLTLQSGGALYRFETGVGRNYIDGPYTDAANTFMSAGSVDDGNVLISTSGTDGSAFKFMLLATPSIQLGPTAAAFQTGNTSIGTNYAGFWEPGVNPATDPYSFAAGATTTFVRGAGGIYLQGPTQVTSGGAASNAMCWMSDGKSLGHCTTAFSGTPPTCTCSQ